MLWQSFMHLAQGSRAYAALSQVLTLLSLATTVSASYTTANHAVDAVNITVTVY
jgi:hypothetical protein